MSQRFLGRSGIRVSPLTLGCMMFGGRTEAPESFSIIDRAIDAGINFLDTANVYNQGRSEEIVGDALKRNGHRHHIVLATRVHGNMHPNDALDPNKAGNSRRQIIEQAEASLRRLKTDYIDLYQIHRPQPETPIDETLRALDDLVRSGKVRYIGSSTFAAWQVVEALCRELDHRSTHPGAARRQPRRPRAHVHFGGPEAHRRHQPPGRCNRALLHCRVRPAPVSGLVT